jgi:HEAT repeat protein
MLATCLILAIPVIADHLVQRSNDPYTILWARLLSSSESDRCTAARALGAFGSKIAIKPLRAGLESAGSDERLYRATSLLELNYSDNLVIEIIEQHLRAGPRALFRRKLSNYPTSAPKKLGARGAPLVPMLLKLVSTCPNNKGGEEAQLLAAVAPNNPKVTEELVRLLARVEVREAKRRLDASGVPVDASKEQKIAALDSEANLNEVILAISELGPQARKSIPELEKHLTTPDMFGRYFAAATILKFEPGHKRAAEILSESASKGDVKTRGAVGGVLASIKLPLKVSLPLIRLLIENPDLDQQSFIGGCLALVNLDEADDATVALLTKRLSDKRQRIALEAAFHLARLRPHDYTEANIVLAACLQSSDKPISLSAAHFCAQLKTPDKSLTLGLAKGLKNESVFSASKCALTLLRIDEKSKEARDLTLNCLRNDHPDKQYAHYCAAEIIAQFGRTFKGARPDLIALLRESDEECCAQIVLAIKAIDSAK